MPDFLNRIFFSEFLADNAGNTAVNVNGQGGTNKQDEFVELQNASSATIDIGGYQIWSAKNGLLHTFAPGSQIAPGGTATVVGTYTNPPAGFFGANGNNNSAQGNGGFLEDGEGAKNDTLYLSAPDGNYIRLSYGLPPQVPGSLPAGFPTGGALQGDGETVNTSAPNGTSVLRTADGDLVEGSPTPGTPGLVCFVSGTMISTDLGPVCVDALLPGMRVISMDKGSAPLRAVRKTTIGRSVLTRNPDMHMVVVPVGVLGNPSPLQISPAHRILLSGADVELLFAAQEVLVSARQLVGYAGIHVDMSDRPVTYVHLLFDDHEVILAEGCWTESLFLGDAAQAMIAESPEWQVQDGVDLARMAHDATARPVLKGYQAAALVKALGGASPQIASAA